MSRLLWAVSLSLLLFATLLQAELTSLRENVLENSSSIPDIKHYYK